MIGLSFFFFAPQEVHVGTGGTVERYEEVACTEPPQIEHLPIISICFPFKIWRVGKDLHLHLH